MPRFIIAILFTLAVNIGFANVANNWANAYVAAKHQATNPDDGATRTSLVLKQDENEETVEQLLKASSLSALSEITLFFAYSFSDLNTYNPVTKAYYTPQQDSPPLFLRIGVILI